MLEEKYNQIRNFCVTNSDQKIIDKYSKYFKDGFDGYGIDRKVFEDQKDFWIKTWKDEMTIEKYLDLSDIILEKGKGEEISFAICFLKSESANFTEVTFNRISKWFDLGIDNWATTDVLCMLVLSSFFIDKRIELSNLKEWNTSNSEWQRRAVPVTLVELIKNDLSPEVAIPIIEPLMLDKSQYVQKGIGTLLRGLWKIYPYEIEEFLLKWKDNCGRLIVQYTTEKMDKDYRKKFRKAK